MSTKTNDLMELFYEEPERDFHVRELARLLKKSPTTISKELKDLKKQGLLISKKQYNHLFFKANNENTLFIEYKRQNNLMNIRKSGLIEHINKEYNYPEAIILFGSYQKGDNIPRSDIDILIITSSKKETDFSIYEKRLKHKIQIFQHSNKEISEFKEKHLINSWINGIVLEGYWELYNEN